MFPSKVTTVEDAVRHLKTGMTLMSGGFQCCGIPETLLKAVSGTDAADLTVITLSTALKGRGTGILIHEGKVRKLYVSHIGSNTETVEKTLNGELECVFVPQGTLAERIRAGGSGLGGILTPTGLGTPIADGKEILTVNGKEYLLELPLHADIAFIHAWKADTMGNLAYHYSARNYNPLMAMAADFVIAEAETIVEAGELGPDEIETPACVVDVVVQGEPVRARWEV